MDLLFVGFLILCLHFGASKDNFKSQDVHLTDIMDMLNENKVLQDPHDMLAPPKKSRHNLIQAKKLEDKNSSDEQCEEKVIQCLSSLDETNSLLKMEKERIVTFQKQLASKGIEFEAFYSRILHIFWYLLKFEEAEKLLGRGNKSVRRHLAVDVNEANIAAFKEFFNENKAHTQIDNFFEFGFVLLADDENPPYFQVIFEKIKNLHFNLQTIEAWIFILWILVIVIFVGLIYSLLKMFRNFTLAKGIGLLLFLLFVISYLVQWNNMIKVEELKRLQNLEGETRQKNIFEKIWSLFSEVQSPKLRNDLHAEIPPMVVLSDVTAKLLLQPLPELATQLANFFNNFFGNIPWKYMFQSTLLLIIFVIVFTLAFFGYGIHLPLWFGGIYPSPKSQDHSAQIRQLIQENEQNMKKICKDAQEMLSHISESSISYSKDVSQAYSEHLVVHSAQVMENNLKHIIDARFSSLQSSLGLDILPTTADSSTLDNNQLTVTPLEKDEVDGDLYEHAVCSLSIRQRKIREKEIIDVPLRRENERGHCYLCDDEQKKDLLPDYEIRSRIKNVVSHSQH